MSSTEHLTLKQLNKLLKETFMLWDEIWVGFYWRHYYFNHTQRVRALSLNLGKHEGADLKKLEYASLLHDLTKRYDGKIITDDNGKRILDENGFWHNELLMPKRENLTTKIYQKGNQFRNLHNISGAYVAKKVLELYGFPKYFCDSVSSIIRDHLRPDNFKDFSKADLLEKKILYEADTLDSNLGLSAFYRNIQIRTHYRILEKGETDLQHYINQIEPWIKRKRDFFSRIMTETGNRIAIQRQIKMKESFEYLVDELEDNYIQSVKYGTLSIMQYFMDQNKDPNLQNEMNYLMTSWIPDQQKGLKAISDTKILVIFQRAVNFCNSLSREIRGES